MDSANRSVKTGGTLKMASIGSSMIILVSGAYSGICPRGGGLILFSFQKGVSAPLWA